MLSNRLPTELDDAIESGGPPKENGDKKKVSRKVGNNGVRK